MHTQVGGFWGEHFHLKYSDQMRLCWGVTGGQKCGEGEGAGPSYRVIVTLTLLSEKVLCLFYMSKPV